MSYATKEQLQSLVADLASKVNIPIVEGGGGYAPIGMINGFMGITSPQGWLACDGTVYNIADYSELTDFFESHFGSKNYFGGDGTTTFAVPNLQGEFLRGIGTNSHTDQGNGGTKAGDHQDATSIPTIYTASDNSNPRFIGGLASNGLIFPANTDKTKSTAVSGMQTKSTAVETWSATSGSYFMIRPTNTSVLWCIKAKNNEPGEYTAGDGINILDGEISTDKMPAEDMSEIVTPLPSVMSRRMKYSTDEQIVGEWIDGKPLYQKVIKGVMPTVTTDGTLVRSFVSTDISNTDFRIPVNGFIEYSDASISLSMISNGNLGDAGTLVRWAFDSYNRIRIDSSIVAYSDLDVYFIVQYTKTTD